MPNSILDYFPKNLVPREVQKQTLLAVEKAWQTAEVIVVRVPTGGGKTHISQTIARWSNAATKQKAVTLVPNNLLLEQYLKDYPRLATLQATHRYQCKTIGVSIKERKKREMGLCLPLMDCPGCNNYRRDTKMIWGVPYALLNNYMYIALKFFKHFKTVLVDEAHTVIPLLQDLGSSKIWAHKLPKEYRYPEHVHSIKQLQDWLARIPNELFEESKALSHFAEAASQPTKYMFKAGWEEYGPDLEDRHCLKLIPLDLTAEPQLFFPAAIKKVVLLSATISYKDIEQMGLAKRRVVYINSDSPIPPERRPVHYLKDGLNLSYAYQDANIRPLANLILELLEAYPNDKGLIHAPYSLAAKLAKLPEIANHPRILKHNQENKMEVYTSFREREEPVVLLASGMYEGIDLPYEAGRFQAICKVPYPSLADPAIKFKSDSDKDWYAWETIKTLLQACGRISRTETDFGATYVLDNAFQRLYYAKENDKFWPGWFQEAVSSI